MPRAVAQRASFGGDCRDSGPFWPTPADSPWGLFSLNLRKTLFRLAPEARSGVLAQHLGDSGKAWETGCDEFVDWKSPKLFHRLCPSLRKNPEGSWRCSVDTSRVRPFWGRALVAIAVVGAGLYAAATPVTLTFLLHFFHRPCPVRYASIAWPPAWHEIRQARAGFFFQKAEQAFKANQTVEASMWLSQSYELDRGNYMAGRILAQLWQNNQPEVSDRIYRQLMRDHPVERSQTAQAWRFLALLARGILPACRAWPAGPPACRPGAVRGLAKRRARRQPPNRRHPVSAKSDPNPGRFAALCSGHLQLGTATEEGRTRCGACPPHPTNIGRVGAVRLLLPGRSPAPTEHG